MPDAFINRLRGYGPLSASEVAFLVSACRTTRQVPANHHLIREGDTPDAVFVMLEGWACRYKMLPDGGRQILAFMLPGDFCDIHVAVLEAMDHSVMTLTKARVALLPREHLEDFVRAEATLERALRWAQLVDQDVLRAWIVSMGRRKSVERVAHLMCELHVRMRNIGLATDNECELPLTQIVLADALGLTPVHINRVLRQLRNDNVMEVKRGALHILDSVGLARIAGFDGNYLHGRSRKTLRPTGAPNGDARVVTPAPQR